MQIHAFLKRILRDRAKNNDMEYQDAQSTLPKSVVRGNLLRSMRRGRLVIPDGTEEIPSRMFDGFIFSKDGNISRIVTVVIPASVKNIGERAFGDCKNLQEVILAEGVERIASNAFTGCEKLKKVQLPASIKKIDGWAFYRSGLAEPVFSADGKKLVYYPQTWECYEYRVPEGVEELGSCAFIEAKQLMKVILPQSLKRICSRAFMNCGFTEIAVPEDVVIEREAFANFDHGIRLIRGNSMNALDEKLEYCRCIGIPFLQRQRMKAPKESYWKEDDFRALAQQCAAGSVEAMEEMSNFFSARAKKDAEIPFYQCAAQFWRMRAYRYGSEIARQYLLEWSEANPNARMSAPALDENLDGAAYGEVLNALGFLFFESEREYNLFGIDEHGVVQVSAWESEEPPDEDGFGREECYDWWYLNEFLSLPKGVGYIHSYSFHDKRCNEKRFQALHDQVVAAVRNCD